MSVQRGFMIALSIIACGATLGCQNDDDDSPAGATTTPQGTQGTNQRAGQGGASNAASNASRMAGTGGGAASARGGSGTSQTSGGRADAGAGTVGGAGDALDDEQVAQFMLTVNRGEIEQGELAMMRASDERVRAYATRMVTEHTAANVALTALTERLGIIPMETAQSRQVMAEAGSTLESLRAAPDAEFDLAYMTAQVMQHERVLMVFDSVGPDLADDDLRGATEMMRRSVAEHLEDGRTLQTALSGD
jgi:putative membrane protein